MISQYSKDLEASTIKEESNFSLIVRLGLLSIPLTLVILVYTFSNYGTVAPSEIGQIGEFFGGWLTPVVGLFIGILLILTLRFQMQQLRITRLALAKSTEVQNKVAETQQDLLTRSYINFELESSARGLISLVEQADSILNTKVNIYVDILNFDNKLPHETRLFNVIDSWNQDLEHGKSFDIKFRHGRDAKVVAKYLHNIHHEIYICQTLVKNKGWVYISPYVKSIAEHVEAIVTLNAVKLVTEKEMWLVKHAVKSILEKMPTSREGAILDGEIIAKLIRDKFDALYSSLPTLNNFESEQLVDSAEATSEDDSTKVSLF